VYSLKFSQACCAWIPGIMQSTVGEAGGAVGYGATLLSRGQALPAGGWVADASWLGGLSAAAGVAWRLLAAHPKLRLFVTGYIAVEGLFYGWSKQR
jgi:hypothetical protein